MELFDLDILVSEACELFRPLAAAKSIDLQSTVKGPLPFIQLGPTPFHTLMLYLYSYGHTSVALAYSAAEKATFCLSLNGFWSKKQADLGLPNRRHTVVCRGFDSRFLHPDWAKGLLANRCS
jgi:hypothetical protein